MQCNWSKKFLWQPNWSQRTALSYFFLTQTFPSSYRYYQIGQAHSPTVLHYFKKEKTCPVFLSIYKNMSGSLGEWEMLWEQQTLQGECFHSFLSSLILSWVFLWLVKIETHRTCFLFLLEHTVMKKERQLVYFDHQDVNSLCSCHCYVNSLC